MDQDWKECHDRCITQLVTSCWKVLAGRKSLQTSPPLGAIDDVELEFKKGDQNLGPSPKKNGVPSKRNVAMSFG